MKIEKLKDNQAQISMFMKINELIDAHNATQPDETKDLTFEEALVFFKAGKKIGRKDWMIEDYLCKDCGVARAYFHMLENDWRVLDE